MSDEKALLAAIWEHPHEDTPRLMYADWLDEHGDAPRAEFIRVQVALARLDEWDESPRKAELDAREKQLWDRHAEDWKAVVPGALRKRTSFHRGFPAPPRQKLSPGKFLKLTAADLAAAPLWAVEISTNRTSFPDLLASPNILRVGTLGFSGWLDTPQNARLFGASAYVRNLSTLDLRYTPLGVDELSALAAASAGLPNLRRLDLKQTRLTTAALAELLRSPLADGLEELLLGENPLGPDGVLALAESPRLKRLRCLSVYSCGRQGGSEADLTGGAVKALCASRHLRNLRELYLSHNSLGTGEVRAMCESRPAFRLAVLSLGGSYSGFGDAGAEALAAWPGLKHVRRLVITGGEIGAVGGRALARSPHLGNVKELWIQGNPVLDDPTAAAILRKRFGDALRVD